MSERDSNETWRSLIRSTRKALPIAAIAAFLAVGCSPADSSEAPEDAEEAALVDDGNEEAYGEEGETYTYPNGDAAAAADDEVDDEPIATPSTLTVPAGSGIVLTLGDELGTRTSEVGGRFSAVVRDPVHVLGSTAIPSGARVEGTVTAVQQASDDRPGVLKLDVETISIAGHEYELAATVAEVSPEIESSSSTGEDVAKVGVTTAAGAILGRVIGGSTESTLIGAAVGAAAGTAVVLTTKDEHAVLPAGSEMQLTLDAPLIVDRPGE